MKIHEGCNVKRKGLDILGTVRRVSWSGTAEVEWSDKIEMCPLNDLELVDLEKERLIKELSDIKRESAKLSKELIEIAEK